MMNLLFVTKKISMNEHLKNKIISTLQYLADQSSKEVLITDRISTSEDNYNRHFTTTSQLKFKTPNV